MEQKKKNDQNNLNYRLRTDFLRLCFLTVVCYKKNSACTKKKHRSRWCWKKKYLKISENQEGRHYTQEEYVFGKIKGCALVSSQKKNSTSHVSFNFRMNFRKKLKRFSIKLRQLTLTKEWIKSSLLAKRFHSLSKTAILSYD